MLVILILVCGQATITPTEQRMLDHIVASVGKQERATAQHEFTEMTHKGRKTFYLAFVKVHGHPECHPQVVLTPEHRSPTHVAVSSRPTPMSSAPRYLTVTPHVRVWPRYAPRHAAPVLYRTPLPFLQGNVGSFNCGPSG